MGRTDGSGIALVWVTLLSLAALTAVACDITPARASLAAIIAPPTQTATPTDTPVPTSTPTPTTDPLSVVREYPEREADGSVWEIFQLANGQYQREIRIVAPATPIPATRPPATPLEPNGVTIAYPA